MNALDIAAEIIVLGKTAGLRREIIELQTHKLSLLTDQLQFKETLNVQLQQENTALKIENNQLRQQLNDYQPVTKPGDPCPYCNRPTGKLLNITPHPHLGAAGLKVYHYQCQGHNCGKTYERDGD